MQEQIDTTEQLLRERRASQAAKEQDRLQRSKRRVQSRPEPSSREEKEALLTTQFVRESFQPGWPFVTQSQDQDSASQEALPMTAGLPRLGQGGGQVGWESAGSEGAEERLPWIEEEDGGEIVWRGAGADDGGRGGRLLAGVEARQELAEFKEDSALYRVTAPLQVTPTHRHRHGHRKTRHSSVPLNSVRYR